jgi:hypothetical protein
MKGGARQEKEKQKEKKLRGEKKKKKRERDCRADLPPFFFVHRAKRRVARRVCRF